MESRRGARWSVQAHICDCIPCTSGSALAHPEPIRLMYDSALYQRNKLITGDAPCEGTMTLRTAGDDHIMYIVIAIRAGQACDRIQVMPCS